MSMLMGSKSAPSQPEQQGPSLMPGPEQHGRKSLQLHGRDASSAGLLSTRGWLLSGGGQLSGLYTPGHWRQLDHITAARLGTQQLGLPPAPLWSSSWKRERNSSCQCRCSGKDAITTGMSHLYQQRTQDRALLLDQLVPAAEARVSDSWAG